MGNLAPTAIQKKNILASMTPTSHYSFLDASETLKRDRSFILEASEINPTILMFTNDELIRKDKEIYSKAIRKWPKALEYSHFDLRNDKEFMLDALDVNGQIIRYASEELRSDEDVVLKSLTNGKNLQYASEILRKNPEFALKAVKKCKKSFIYFSEELKNDRTLNLLHLGMYDIIKINLYRNVEFRFK